MTWQIPLSDVSFGPEEFTAVEAVLKSGWLTMGEVTQAFEREFAEAHRVKHAFAAANGTAALHMACAALGLQPGDEVIVPSLTFVATANAIRYTGATPVFADITSDQDLCISPESILANLSERTRAIMIMHYAGYPCDMSRIMKIADEHKLFVIEDAAHAAGASLDNRYLGTFGDIGCYSFFSNKNMTTGEGGMVVTNNDVLAEKIRILRSHGMTTLTWDRHQGHAWSYDVVDLGYNYRIDELRAAIGRVQLGKLAANNARRGELTKLYHDSLQELAPEITVPFQKPSGSPAYHIMPILLPKGIDRIAFMEHMKASGIQTSIHYPPIHRFSIYRQKNELPPYDLPITEDVADREVTLPLYPKMTDDDVLSVVNAVQKALRDTHVPA
jgi:dTDP-4-amino-4,6-dideoxygalactose transaminase